MPPREPLFICKGFNETMYYLVNAMRDEIPSNILQEAYQAIAERRSIPLNQLKAAEVPEKEVYSAIAYARLMPEVSLQDLSNDDLLRAASLCRELDIEALRDYHFIPLLTRNGMLLAITSCPWNPETVEITPGYFTGINYTRFMFARAEYFEAILNRIQGLIQANTRTPGPVPASVKAPPATTMAAPTTTPAAPKIIPPKALEGGRTIVYAPKPPSSAAPTAPAPAVKTTQVPNAPPPVGTVPKLPATTIIEGLTPEETAQLVTQFIQQANRIIASRKKTP